MYINQRT